MRMEEERRHAGRIPHGTATKRRSLQRLRQHKAGLPIDDSDEGKGLFGRAPKNRGKGPWSSD